MKIALVGGTGRIGQHLAAEALSMGHDVTVIARHASGATSASMSLPDGPMPRTGALRHVRADLFDPEALAEAVRGHDAIVSAFAAPPEMPMRVADAAKALVDAARAAVVRRLMVVGGAGSLEVTPGIVLADTPGFPAALRPKAVAHSRAIDVLRRAPDLDWTWFAPAAEIADGPRTGTFRRGSMLVADAAGRSRISYADFAAAFVDELAAARWLRQVMTAGY
ncbi:NAD(P)H-binding protein [soil metagenome]